MFSEKLHNWAKIFELFTGAMKVIAIGMIPETGALQPTQPQPRSYSTSVHPSASEAQREWAMANVRIANVNR